MHIYDVLNEMSDCLSITQLKKLQEIMMSHLDKKDAEPEHASNEEYLKMFLGAKQIEGCSERTINYYNANMQNLIEKLDIPVRKMTTEDVRIWKKIRY